MPEEMEQQTIRIVRTVVRECVLINLKGKSVFEADFSVAEQGGEPLELKMPTHLKIQQKNP